MLLLSSKLRESVWDTDWVIMLTISSGYNYMLNEQRVYDQYDTYTVLSEITPCYSHLKSLEDLFDELIEFSC